VRFHNQQEFIFIQIDGSSVPQARCGRFGKFLAYSGFPDGKNTKQTIVSGGLTCPDCGGNIVMKKRGAEM
jgi:ssDNA-binding Zn-finger/Zn-ribbon topoisomerase 1